ncbi:hypothetical protein [Limisalsivibrio acetivorans]|uniref:hypothetical protein n=1 Tax=Limisalsivibrio acetivorans TaxID=1304888 RepID=UPI0003B3DCA1|nr:hypothetical protein [Limisalsivibrio acetivorans]
MILEIAKTGSYGDTVITPEILGEIAASFAGDVPVTAGHELADSMPALGWVKRIWVEGDTLLGEVELTGEMQKAFDGGEYRRWSIGARKREDGYYLHHLAFLGSVPPMIKDLEVIEMGDTEDFITIPVEPEGGVLTNLEELRRLREEVREIKIEQMRRAGEGKIPAFRLETAVSFARESSEAVNMADGSRIEAADLLIDLFGSLPEMVKPGSDMSRAGEHTSVSARCFSKI